MQKKNKGFTLIEMLVVVLIIGILAGIALPQYQMAVTKAKVASILPLMRRWKDALQEYKLQHGDYEVYDGDTLGVNWTFDKNCGNHKACADNYWDCMANEDGTGYVYCYHDLGNDVIFSITMYQYDDPDCEICRNKTTCAAWNSDPEAHKICKALGGKLADGGDIEYILY